jgi:exodeoxyribonuclease VII small subunit
MQEPTFEGSLKRLEEIVAQLEGNKLDLEQSLEIFEEGVKLVRFCASRLDEAERRIEILLADKEGRVQAEPFPEESEDAAGETERP